MATVLKGRSEYPFDRLVAGLEETRLELGLSRAKLARLAGVSPETVRVIERGHSRSWPTVVKLRTALTMVELSMPPRDDELIEVLVARAAIVGA